MAEEIERRFIVIDLAAFEHDTKVNDHEGSSVIQAYFDTPAGMVSRVRLVVNNATDKQQGFITNKFNGAGIIRKEYEYEIPPDDAYEMIEHLALKVSKVRVKVPYQGHVLEVDYFSGLQVPIIEVELPHIDTPLELPSWAHEITDLRGFSNFDMAKNYHSVISLLRAMVPAC